MARFRRWGLYGLLVLASLGAQGSILSGAPWPRAESALQSGWNPYQWDRLTERLADSDSDAFLVIEHGKIVYEYGVVDRPMRVGEMHSGVLNVLFGAAMQAPDLDIRSNVSAEVYEQMLLRKDSYFPESCLESFWSSTVADAPNGATGWSFQPAVYGFLAQYYELKKEQGPDVGFYFYLVAPLQMQDVDMSRAGCYVPNANVRQARLDFYLSARDLARLGELYLRDGIWGDQPIVDKRWIAQSWQPHAYQVTSWTGQPSGDYGLGWWLSNQGVHYPGVSVPEGTVSLRDQSGQFLLVVPSLELVLVHRIDPEKGARISDEDCGALIMSVFKAKRYVS